MVLLVTILVTTFWDHIHGVASLVNLFIQMVAMTVMLLEINGGFLNKP
jgi:hypothetical protein